ncbi:MAG TPA: NAD-dependent epimerase/dehydratase family protein [Isosphaeraceae bacterium]|nr:NAD-dependent epimerase/dehydratase family protein [Isosphaeraceae bacterium]
MKNHREQGNPSVGLVEWFRPGEHERVEQVLSDLNALGVNALRTGFSWADYHSKVGESWYDWLIPRLASEVEVLPCFHYTPPSLGVRESAASPPREPKAYADFIDVAITRFGRHFEWVELWNEPNNLSDWDWRLDPQWQIFCEMVGGAAFWVRQRGKRAVLGGPCPTDINWLNLMGERGVLGQCDAVGVHGFPGTWDFDWEDWSETIRKVREVVHEYQPNAEIWITEAGFSTCRHEEGRQLSSFLRALEAPVERLYWYSVHDLHPDLPTQDGLHSDERHYHMGLKRTDGTPKLLQRLWESRGLEGLREVEGWCRPATWPDGGKAGHILITGGAGFIGMNLADRLLREGERVILLDNLARAGVERNYEWLREEHGDRVQLELADVRDRFVLRQAVKGAEQVFHFAGRVSGNTSPLNPIDEFEVNTRGTLTLLEELRALASPPPLVFTSTNKVYGTLDGISLRDDGLRYEPLDEIIRRFGISEDHPLCFHSAHGCSKGSADQYVLDYARGYGLNALVFRMGCIYGPQRFGGEDQGWVTHFLIRAAEDEPITLYGDGKQVRDVLFVDDLVEALLLAQRHGQKLSGRAFNVGGGPGSATSLLEMIDWISEIQGQRPTVQMKPWRAGDQRYYVSDTRRYQVATGWAPRVDLQEGLRRLHHWLNESRGFARTPDESQGVIV